MRLSEWLKATKTAQAAFGKRIGVTQSRVSQIAAGGTKSLPTALAIQRETAGAVPLNEIMPESAEAAAE